MLCLSRCSLRAVTINYHHLAASRAASVDDDEEEEDKLHAMLSMICSRNLTAPNPMKGFYPTPSPCPTLSFCPTLLGPPATHRRARMAVLALWDLYPRMVPFHQKAGPGGRKEALARRVDGAKCSGPWGSH